MRSMEMLDDKYRLLKGDIIVVRTPEDPECNFMVKVRDDGDVVMPYIGAVHAKGLTCRQLALQVQQELAPKYLKRATVLIGISWG
jgi:protein involved in polysaccharide export with SLBB domain